MELELESGGEAIGEHPFHKGMRGEAGTAGDFIFVRLFVDGGEEDGGTTLIELMGFDHGAGPFVVRAIENDEFYFIMGSEVIEVLEEVFAHFAAAGCLEIEDTDSAGIAGGNIEGAGGFDEDGFFEIAETGDEIVDAFLGKGFAAGDFDEVGGVGGYFSDDVFDGLGLSFPEGIFGVTIAAAEGTAGETNEDTGAAGVGGFTLNGVKNLRDAEGGSGHEGMVALWERKSLDRPAVCDILLARTAQVAELADAPA